MGISEMKIRDTDTELIQRSKKDGWRWAFSQLDDEPKGGVAILYDTTEIKNAIITPHNKNIISMRDMHRKIITITVYMPSGAKAEVREAREKMYGIIESIIADAPEEYHIIIGGDFNGRIRANGDTEENEAGRRMLTLASQKDVIVVNTLAICTDQFTRIQTMKHRLDRSTLDYVLVSRSLLSSITSLRFLSRQRGSDHKPTELTFHLSPTSPIKSDNQQLKKTPTTTTTRFNTDRIGNPGWGRYEEEIDELTEEWKQYKKELDDLQANGQTHQEGICELMEMKLREIMTTAAIKAIGVRRVSERKKKSYIDREIAELSEVRDEAERIMNKMHTPLSGATESDRERTREDLMTKRTEVKRAIKRKKRKERESLDREISGSVRSTTRFWTYVKQRWKTGSREFKRVERSDGTVLEDDQEIREEVKNYMTDLGKDEDDERTNEEDRFDTKMRERIVEQLKKVTKERGSTPELEGRITEEEVKEALKKVRLNKAPGTDGISNEMLKRGGDGLTAMLSDIFNYIWEHEIWPEKWREGKIVSLHKDGDHAKLDNYRGITLLSCISKAFEKILNTRLYNWMETSGRIEDEQGGFRKTRSSTDQSFLLHEIITRRKEKKKPTVCMFIDVKKAYDRVWRDGLWAKMYEEGIQGKMWMMIRAMYSKMTRRALVNGEMTESFAIDMGVPQGSILSPLLYSIYINGLIRELKENEIGAQIDEDNVCILCYADDIVLISEDEMNMRRMLDIASNYAHEWRFRFNNSKSNLIVFGDEKMSEKIQKEGMKLSGREVKVVDEYKYLGIDMTNKQQKWKTTCERMIDKAERQSSTLKRNGCAKGQLSVTASRQLLKSIVIPIWEFGVEIWEGTKEHMRKFESIQSDFARRVITISTRATNAFACCEAAIKSVQARRDELIIRWHHRVSSTPQTRLFKRMLERRRKDVDSKDKTVGKMSALVKVKKILYEYGLESEWRGRRVAMDPDAWKKFVKDMTDEKDRERKVKEMEAHPQLHFYIDHLLPEQHLIPHLWLSDINNPRTVQLRSELRSSTLPLAVTIARWKKKDDMESKKCPLCERGTEDEEHFLTKCKKLREERKVLAKKMEECVSKGVMDATHLQSYKAADKQQRMLMLLGKIESADEDHTLKAHKVMGNFIYKCWKKRCELLQIEPFERKHV